MKYKKKTYLKKQFLFMYFIFILIPSMGLSAIFWNNTRSQLRENLENVNQNSFRQTAQLIDYFVANVNNYMNELLGTEEFHRIIEQDNSRRSIHGQMEDMTTLQSLSAFYRSQTEICDIRLYIKNEAIYIGESAWTKPYSMAETEPWYHYLVERLPKGTMIPTEYLEKTDIISYGKNITNSKSYLENIGILRFDIRLSKIEELLGSDVPEEQLTILINSDGIVIDTAESELYRRLESKYEDGFESILPTKEIYSNDDGESHLIRWNGNTYLLYSEMIENTDWYLVYLIPYDMVLKNMISQNWIYLIILLIICISGFVFTGLFLKLFFKRISRISKHMSGIQTALPSLLKVTDKNDEIDELVGSYNYMISRIDELMKEQYELGNQIKEAEVKALYEQINPHFLYNTLSMITWLAEDGQVEDVSRVINALSSFYKLSLNNGAENICLKEELKIIRHFVYIQQMRTGAEITLNIISDPVYDSFVIPKLTLQPLVENALVHGILMKRERNGSIEIRVSDENDMVKITIHDNGIGIDQEMLDRLNDGIIKSSQKHYGISNVMQRLKLFYKDCCIVRFESVQHEGTTVTLLLKMTEP